MQRDSSPRSPHLSFVFSLSLPFPFFFTSFFLFLDCDMGDVNLEELDERRLGIFGLFIFRCLDWPAIQALMSFVTDTWRMPPVEILPFALMPGFCASFTT